MNLLVDIGEVGFDVLFQAGITRMFDTIHLGFFHSHIIFTSLQKITQPLYFMGFLDEERQRLVTLKSVAS